MVETLAVAGPSLVVAGLDPGRRSSHPHSHGSGPSASQVPLSRSRVWTLSVAGLNPLSGGSRSSAPQVLPSRSRVWTLGAAGPALLVAVPDLRRPRSQPLVAGLNPRRRRSPPSRSQVWPSAPQI